MTPQNRAPTLVTSSLGRGLLSLPQPPVNANDLTQARNAISNATARRFCTPSSHTVSRHSRVTMPGSSQLPISLLRDSFIARKNSPSGQLVAFNVDMYALLSAPTSTWPLRTC